MKASSSPKGLSQFLNGSDGIYADEALKRAELHMASMHDALNAGVNDTIDQIREIFLASEESISPEVLRNLRQLADTIYSVAATIEMETLGKVAFSLCDLIEFVEQNKSCSYMPAMRLHADAMRLLVALPKISPDQEGALLASLNEMVFTLTSKPRRTEGPHL